MTESYIYILCYKNKCCHWSEIVFIIELEAWATNPFSCTLLIGLIIIQVVRLILAHTVSVLKCQLFVKTSDILQPYRFTRRNCQEISSQHNRTSPQLCPEKTRQLPLQAGYLDSKQAGSLPGVCREH